jgi:hypothetical protein
VRKRLSEEAGGKCANPGCSTRRTQLHHIKEWAVYGIHDPAEMIALCPTCHDAVHHGQLKISDETLRAWKRISRGSPVRGHVYVEPRSSPVIVLGTIDIHSKHDTAVFELARSQRLSFRVVDNELMFLEARLQDVSGREVISVRDNHLTCAPRDDVTHECVPGRFELTTSDIFQFLPPWAVEQLRAHEPDFGGQRNIVLSVVVEAPGRVRVCGIWGEYSRAIVVTESAISFLDPGRPLPLSFVGAGAGRTTLLWDGPITKAMFGIA